jgi:hypothetical protein
VVHDKEKDYHKVKVKVIKVKKWSSTRVSA